MTKAIVVRVEGDYVITAQGADLLSTLASQASAARDEADASAAEANTAADRSEDARDLAELASLTLPNVYETTGDGLAAVAEGDTFWVEGAAGPTLYRKVSGAAVELDKILSETGLSADDGGSYIVQKQSFAGSFARSIADYFEDDISVMSFIPLVERVKVRLGTSTADLGYAFNAAIDACASRGGGSVRVPTGLYYASGIEPKSGVTLAGEMARILLPAGASSPMIYYNDAATLGNFNLSNLILYGNNVEQDGIHITEPSPVAPGKTWNYSTLFNIQIRNFGGIGLYTPIPGRVRLLNSWVYGNDIGVAWDREHLDIYGTQIEGNRLGVRSTGNHFVAMHCSIAHNTEAGWTTVGAGLGLYSDVYESSFLGCTFLDNPIHVQGAFFLSRFTGNRHATGNGVEQFFDGRLDYCSVVGNEMYKFKAGALVALGHHNVVMGNVIVGSTAPLSTGIGSSSVGGNIDGNLITSNHVRQCSTAIDLNAGGGSRTVLGNTIDGNQISFCGGGIALAAARPYNVIENNRLRDIGTTYAGSGIGIAVTGTGGSIDSLAVESNKFTNIAKEAVLISHNTTIFSLSVTGNRVLDANRSNTTDTDAIAIAAPTAAAIVGGNLARNAVNGKARYAIRMTGAAADVLLDGNVSRGMIGANSYKVPAAGVTQGSNIGTVDAS